MLKKKQIFNKGLAIEVQTFLKAVLQSYFNTTLEKKKKRKGLSSVKQLKRKQCSIYIISWIESVSFTAAQEHKMHNPSCTSHPQHAVVM